MAGSLSADDLKKLLMLANLFLSGRGNPSQKQSPAPSAQPLPPDGIKISTEQLNALLQTMSGGGQAGGLDLNALLQALAAANGGKTP